MYIIDTTSMILSPLDEDARQISQHPVAAHWLPSCDQLGRCKLGVPWPSYHGTSGSFQRQEDGIPSSTGVHLHGLASGRPPIWLLSRLKMIVFEGEYGRWCFAVFDIDRSRGNRSSKIGKACASSSRGHSVHIGNIRTSHCVAEEIFAKQFFPVGITLDNLPSSLMKPWLTDLHQLVGSCCLAAGEGPQPWISIRIPRERCWTSGARGWHRRLENWGFYRCFIGFLMGFYRDFVEFISLYGCYNRRLTHVDWLMVWSSFFSIFLSIWDGWFIGVFRGVHSAPASHRLLMNICTRLKEVATSWFRRSESVRIL